MLEDLSKQTDWIIKYQSRRGKEKIGYGHLWTIPSSISHTHENIVLQIHQSDWEIVFSCSCFDNLQIILYYTIQPKLLPGNAKLSPLLSLS